MHEPNPTRCPRRLGGAGSRPCGAGARRIRRGRHAGQGHPTRTASCPPPPSADPSARPNGTPAQILQPHAPAVPRLGHLQQTLIAFMLVCPSSVSRSFVCMCGGWRRRYVHRGMERGGCLPRSWRMPLPSTRSASGRQWGARARRRATRAASGPTSRKARNPGRYGASMRTSTVSSYTTCPSTRHHHVSNNQGHTRAAAWATNIHVHAAAWWAWRRPWAGAPGQGGDGETHSAPRATARHTRPGTHTHGWGPGPQTRHPHHLAA
jgi:hypothetical protein